LSQRDSLRAATTPTRLVLLLSVALLINYVDRGNLSTAAPLIQRELHLSNTQLGFLLSAFFYTYVAAMTPAGWLGERYGAHRVLGAGVLIGHCDVLDWLRGRLRLTVAPAAHARCRRECGIPVQLEAGCRRRRASAYRHGQRLDGFRIPRRPVDRHDRRRCADELCRLAAGFHSIRCAVAPLALALEQSDGSRPAAAQHILEGRRPDLFTNSARAGFMGASLGHFSSNYNFYFILAWLPEYLVTVRGFSMQVMAGSPVALI